MKILVTGSRGVVGTALCRKLRSLGLEVWGVDLTHSQASMPFHDHLYGGGRYYRADVGDWREISRVINVVRPDLVYHAAAEFGRWNGEDYYERLWKSNCIGTRNILELQKQHEFVCVYFSSSEVYGDYSLPMEEHAAHSCDQLNDYAISKWANEQQVLSTPDINAVRVRLFNTYGPGEYYTPYRSVACRFAYRLLKGMSIKVSDGHMRGHTWLPDCIHALAEIAMNHTVTIGNVYNIGTTQEHSIMELATKLVQHTGAEPQLLQISHPEPRTTRRKRVVNQAAIDDLGYEDTMDLDEGLKQTVEWMKHVYNV